MDPNRFLEKTEKVIQEEIDEEKDFIKVPILKKIEVNPTIESNLTIEEIISLDIKNIEFEINNIFKTLLDYIGDLNSDPLKIESHCLERSFITMQILESIAYKNDYVNIGDGINSKQIIQLLFNLFQTGFYEINSFIIKRSRCYLILFFKKADCRLYRESDIDFLYDEFSYDSIKCNNKSRLRKRLGNEFNPKELSEEIKINYDNSNDLFCTIIYSDDIKNEEDSDDEIDPEYLYRFEKMMKTFKPNSDNILNREYYSELEK